MDRHAGFSYSVHGTTDKRGLECNVASDLGVGDNFASGKVDFTGKNEEVIVGEAASARGVKKLRDRKTVLRGIGLQNIECGRRVKVGLGRR